MTVCTRMKIGISVVVLSLNFVLATASFAQDAMQLDIDFKNALSQAPHVVQEPIVQGPRDEEKNAGRRAEKGGPPEKGRHGEAVARR